MGENYWIWVFAAPAETFVVIRKSRGIEVMMGVLMRKFRGTIVFDGWKPYAKFAKRIQRCWDHLLRESEDLAEMIPEVIPLQSALRKIYDLLNGAMETISLLKFEECYGIWPELCSINWLMQCYACEKVRKLIGKISNVFEYLLTFVIQLGMEPSNNRAEWAIREHVIQRKIVGTLRNSKGTAIHERLMTVLATWSQEGLESLQMLRLKLSN